MGGAAAARVVVGMRLGLGDAVLRLVHVEAEAAGLAHPDRPALLRERALLLEALNRIPIELGFDCDGDGLADAAMPDADGDGAADVSLFEHSAATSCCRILPPPVVEAAPAVEPAEAKAAPKGKAKARRRSTSRRRS